MGISANSLLAQLPTATERIVVACSGGMDSTVLFHIARQTGWPLHVVHVHHGLQQQADEWARHVVKLANQAKVPCDVLKVQPSLEAGGLEAGARAARYAALESFLKPGDCLLTAHHADDQVETLLLRILRGTGPMGLVGIRHCQPFGTGVLLRPLLAIPYQALHRYAEEHQLSWMDDPSNEQLNFERNYLRHRVIPALQDRWPSVQQTVGRLACLTEETEVVFKALLQEKLAHHRHANTPLLSVATLIRETRPMQAAILRAWLAELNWRPPTQRQLEQGLHDLLWADQDKQPVLDGADGQVARFSGALYRLPKYLPGCPTKGVIRRGETVSWGQVGEIHWHANGLPEQADELEMRAFWPGDRVQFPHRPSQAVKELLRQAGIPPWWRSHLPLLTNAQSEVVSIAGVAPSDGVSFYPNPDPDLADWRYWHA